MAPRFRTILVALVLVPTWSALLVPAAEHRTQPQPQTPASPRAFLVALSVEDIHASVRWYTENLGFRSFFPVRDAQRGRLHATLELNGFFIDLISRPKATVRTDVMVDSREPASITGIYRLGIIVPDLDKIVKQQRERGNRLATQVDGGWGIRWCDLEDPDGNSVWAIQQMYSVKPAA